MPDPRNRLNWNATCKVYPAVADLQAIESFVRVNETVNDVGAPVYEHELYTVPAGKIFVLRFIQGLCAQADPTLIEFILKSGVNEYVFYSAPYGLANERHRWTEEILFDENELLIILWNGTLAATDVNGIIFGHLINKY